MTPSRGRRSITAASAATTARTSAPGNRIRERSTNPLCHMLVAVLSDIHANRHAFEAVLGDVAASEADEIWCLGDVVGYGGEPNECVDIAVTHCHVLLAGNHDM